MYKELIKFVKLVLLSKKIILNLENEILKLNKELDYFRNEVLIFKLNEKVYIFIISDKKMLDFCSCCEKYEKEIKELKNLFVKFFYSKNNLDVILGK